MEMNQSETLSDEVEDITNELEKSLKLENTNDEAEEGEEEDDDNAEFEFFVHGEISSPISAEEVFHNGQIRPIFPLFPSNNVQTEGTTTSYVPPVKKVYVVSSENDVILSSEKLPEMSRKSNSTGFSRLRRVRDFLIRSNSDGKDAFVFLGGKDDENVDTKEKKKVVKISNIKLFKDNINNDSALCNNLSSSNDKKGKEKKKQSIYENLYGKREKKGGKSYLPYRQELVGFYTSANGMSRNVHPY